MEPSYWARLASQRISRRRGLIAAVGSTAVAALLAACGTDSDEGGALKDRSGLLSAPEDTTKSAKRGGTFKDSANADVRTFEPYLRDISVTNHILRTYQTLVRTKPTAFGPGSYDMVEGEAAESWEYSPDKLTLTFKLQPNGKWDARPPTGGRGVDANDVAFSWSRLEAISSIRAELANSVSPSAPIMSVTARTPARW